MLSSNENTFNANNSDAFITEEEYTAIRDFLYRHSGIELGPQKQALVTARLRKRLKHYGMKSYNELLSYSQSQNGSDEQQVIINLLTTNESYFFRESTHFDYLKREVLGDKSHRSLFRLWSAASSTGEEAYSIAMELTEHCHHRPWQIFGSDISTRVLQKAERGLYSLQRTEGIPSAYLKKYCLKGTGEYNGSLLIDRRLRDKVSFKHLNLTQPLPDVGIFDVIFLRNVLIYFDQPTKKDIIHRLFHKLAVGGYLFIGLSESIKGVHPQLKYIAPAIYQRV